MCANGVESVVSRNKIPETSNEKKKKKNCQKCQLKALGYMALNVTLDGAVRATSLRKACPNEI